jgi:threonine/homoserine/homoserine lactone efflux protein
VEVGATHVDLRAPKRCTRAPNRAARDDRHVRDVLIPAVGVAVSPIPIASMLLLLGSRAPGRLGTAFAVGWTVGVLAVLVVFVASVRATGATEESPGWVVVLQLSLGVAFLVAAAVLLLRRSDGTAAAPRWLAAIDQLSPVRTAGLGVAMAAANPKNLALILAAAIALAEADLDGGGDTAAMVAFVTVGSLGVAMPLATWTVRPARSAAALARFRLWLVRHQRVVLVVLGLVLGTKLVYDGLTGL